MTLRQTQPKIPFLPKELEHINEFELIVLCYRIVQNGEGSKDISYWSLNKQTQEIDWQTKLGRNEKILEVIGCKNRDRRRSAKASEELLKCSA